MTFTLNHYKLTYAPKLIGKLHAFLKCQMNDQRNPTNDHKDNPNDKQNAPNVIGTGSASEFNKSPADGDFCESNDRPKSTHARVKYWLELVGIVFGVVGVICLIVQSCAMIQSNTVFSEQLREMQEARKLDERAWVLPVDLSITPSKDTNYAETDIFLKNTGKTPAINVEVMVGCAQYSDDIPKKDTFPNPQIDAMMYPPDGIRHAFNRRVPIGLIQSAINGNSFFIFGTAWYDDIFNRHHWTQFCYRVDSNLHFHALAFHNSCDDIENAEDK